MVQTEITTGTNADCRHADLAGYAYTTSTNGSKVIGAGRAPILTAGVFAALLLAGTGGSISVAATSAVGNAFTSTGSNCRIECVDTRKQDEEDQTIESTAALSLLQHYLSLNLSDLATILRVSRPTIYSWLRDESSPHAANAERIHQLSQLTRFWTGVSGKPLGARLRTPVSKDRSLFDLLSAERLDAHLIRASLISCARLAHQERDQRTRESAAELAKKYGLRPPSKRSQEESVAQETGL